MPIQSIKERKSMLDDVASWSDPAVKVPSNVTGNPPPKSPANMALDQAQTAAENAMKQMGQ